MMKSIIFSIIFLVILSCKDKVQETQEVSVPIGQKTEQEPTTPEETEVWQPVPNEIHVVNGIPSDAIVLFNGSNLDAWITAKDSTAAQWHINGDGSMTVKDKSGDIQTKENFGSIQLHIEWRSPAEIHGENQSRANSGVFLQQKYEIQVLDNNNNPTYVNGQVGSVYKQSIPLVKASSPTGEWNAYDIIFHAPKFDANGNKTKSAFVTVLHNGVLIQDHFEILGTIKYIGLPKYEAHGDAPLVLQDHGDNSRVSYRNIWVRKLD